jgi:hypothetical protein
MKRIGIVLGVILSLDAATAEAVPFQWGSFSVNPGETKRIDLSIGREVKICNNFESEATISVAVGPHDPHRLMPGVCADDIGSDFVVTNHGSGQAFGTWAPSYGNQTSDAGFGAAVPGNQQIGPHGVSPRAS